MPLYLIILLFIFGTAVGSFLNVVILRYKPDRSVFSLESLRGRSRCPYCSRELKWYELIPLFSFVFQSGKCRGCGEDLSLQYPLVELLSGLILAGVPWFLYNFFNIARSSVTLSMGYFTGFAALWVLVFLILLVIMWIDREHYIIPDELNIALGVLGFFIVVMKNNIVSYSLPFTESFLEHFYVIISPFEGIWANHLMGALVGTLFFVSLILLSGGKAMGWGDVKFALAAGFVLGWPDMGLALALSFVIGGIFGAVFLWLDKKQMGDRLPFAPFLISGIVLSVFFGVDIVQGYMLLVGF